MKEILTIEIDKDISSEESWGFTYNSLRSKTKTFKGSKIKVPINSFGGEVLEGTSIYNYFIGYDGEVTTQVIGYAISMGSIIFASGAIREIPKAGYIMVHEPWGYAAGDSEVMEHRSELLELMADNLAAIYADASKRAGKDKYDKAFWRGLMKAETWLTSKEALKYGLATKITDGVLFLNKGNQKKFYASLDTSKYRNIPENIVKKTKAKKMAFNLKSFVNFFMTDDKKIKESEEVNENDMAEKLAQALTEKVLASTIEAIKGVTVSSEILDTAIGKVNASIEENSMATEILAERLVAMEKKVEDLLNTGQSEKEKNEEAAKAHAIKMAAVAKRLGMSAPVSDASGGDNKVDPPSTSKATSMSKADIAEFFNV